MLVFAVIIALAAYADVGLQRLGGSAYLGFTGGTGAAQAQQDISNFTYSSSFTAGPYTNNLVVNAGIFGNVNVLGSTAQPTVTMGNLTLGAGSTLAVAPESGTVANGNYGLILGAATLSGAADFSVANNGTGTGTLTITGALSGGTTLTKDGAGTLTLLGPVSYSGATTINAGRISLDNGRTTTLTTITGGASSWLAVGNTNSATVLNAKSINVDTLTIGGGFFAATAAVPEPGTLVLLALAGLALAGACLRRK